MLGFEPRISGIGSDHSANCATTTALKRNLFQALNLRVIKTFKCKEVQLCCREFDS